MLNNVAAVLGTPTAPNLNSYESISTTTLGSTQATITLGSIPSTYKHLQIRIIGRTDRAATLDSVYMYFNGDTTTSNYYQHGVLGDGSTASSFNGSSNYAALGILSGASATASMFGVAVCDVLDYSSTVKNKTSRSLSGTDLNGSGQIRLVSGLWKNTGAITSVTMTTNGGGSFISGTQIAIYGIKG